MAAISSGSGSSGRWRLLYPQDSVLAEQDQDLPFGRHVVGAGKLIQIIEYPVSIVLVGAEEVVVGDPKSDTVVRPIEVVVAAGSPVGEFEGAIHSFHDLLEWAELFGDCIFVGQTDDLGDVELKVLAVVQIELLSGKRIGRVTVGNETELLRKLLKMLQSHTHGQDACADAAIGRDAVTEDGTGYRIHDEPDKSLFTFDLDVGFITDHVGRGAIVIGVNKGLDDKGCGPGIVGDLLVRDADTIKIVHSLGGLAKRQLQIHMESQAQGHDIGIVFGEIERRSILRKGRQIHFEEVDVELPVDVMKFVAILLKGVLFIDFPEIAPVVGTLRIDTLVNTEAGAVLDWDEDMATVGALVLDRFGVNTPIDKGGAADLALELAFTAVVVVEELMWSTADRTDLVLWNSMTTATAHRSELLAVPVFIVSDQEFPVLFEEWENMWKPVDLEFLVLRRLGVIMDPLGDGYEFTDKLQQKCDLFGLMLNDVKKMEYNVHEQLILSKVVFCRKNIVPKKGVIALFFVEKA